MLSYSMQARRVDHHGSVVRAAGTELLVDTSVAGRTDAMHPVQLLLGALAACVIKGIEREAKVLDFHLVGVEVGVVGERPDTRAVISRIRYEAVLMTEESDERLALLAQRFGRHGTVYATLAGCVRISGELRRATP